MSSRFGFVCTPKVHGSLLFPIFSYHWSGHWTRAQPEPPLKHSWRIGQDEASSPFSLSQKQNLEHSWRIGQDEANSPFFFSQKHNLKHSWRIGQDEANSFFFSQKQNLEYFGYLSPTMGY